MSQDSATRIVPMQPLLPHTHYSNVWFPGPGGRWPLWPLCPTQPPLLVTWLTPFLGSRQDIMTQGGVSKLETLAAENIRGINIETSEQVTENTKPWRKRRDRSQRGKAWMLDPMDSWGRAREERTNHHPLPTRQKEWIIFSSTTTTSIFNCLSPNKSHKL